MEEITWATVNNANIYIETNGGTRMIINNSGNIHIGTINPHSKLDMYGTTTSMSVRGSNEGHTARL